MRDAVGSLTHAWRLLRASTAEMAVLRLVLAIACVACLLCCGSSSAWTWILALVTLAAVVMPDTIAPTIFLAGTLVMWLAVRHHSVAASIGLGTSAAVVHWSAILCSRAPLQARLRPSALSLRQWSTWLVCSALGVLLVLVAGHLGAHLPGGRGTAAGCLIISLALLMVLVCRLPRRRC